MVLKQSQAAAHQPLKDPSGFFFRLYSGGDGVTVRGYFLHNRKLTCTLKKQDSQVKPTSGITV